MMSTPARLTGPHATLAVREQSVLESSGEGSVVGGVGGGSGSPRVVSVGFLLPDSTAGAAQGGGHLKVSVDLISCVEW